VVSILLPANVKAALRRPRAMLAQLHAGTVVKLWLRRRRGAPIPATVDFVSDLAEYTPPVHCIRRKTAASSCSWSRPGRRRRRQRS
jgi:hypothetical protein